MAFAVRQAAPYNILQAFRVPLVQSLFTSNVLPLSNRRLTGLPQIQTPTSSPSFCTPIENLCPLHGLWCRWCCWTYAFACRSDIGMSSSILCLLKRLAAPFRDIEARVSAYILFATIKAAISVPAHITMKNLAFMLFVLSLRVFIKIHNHISYSPLS